MSDWYVNRSSFKLYGVELSIGGPMTSISLTDGHLTYDFRKKAEFYQYKPFGAVCLIDYHTLEKYEMPIGMQTIECLYNTGYILTSFFREHEDPHWPDESKAASQKPGPAWVLDKLRGIIACDISSANTHLDMLTEAHGGIRMEDQDTFYIYIEGMKVVDNTDSIRDALVRVFWKICCLSDDNDAVEAAFDILEERGLVEGCYKIFEDTAPDRIAYLLQRRNNYLKGRNLFGDRLMLL